MSLSAYPMYVAQQEDNAWWCVDSRRPRRRGVVKLPFTLDNTVHTPTRTCALEHVVPHITTSDWEMDGLDRFTLYFFGQIVKRGKPASEVHFTDGSISFMTLAKRRSFTFSERNGELLRRILNSHDNYTGNNHTQFLNVRFIINSKCVFMVTRFIYTVFKNKCIWNSIDLLDFKTN